MRLTPASRACHIECGRNGAHVGGVVLGLELAAQALEVETGGGAALLFAPLLLQPLPDSFVNGRRGLLAFSAAAVVLAMAIWW